MRDIANRGDWPGGLPGRSDESLAELFLADKNPGGAVLADAGEFPVGNRGGAATRSLGRIIDCVFGRSSSPWRAGGRLGIDRWFISSACARVGQQGLANRVERDAERVIGFGVRLEIDWTIDGGGCTGHGMTTVSRCRARAQERCNCRRAAAGESITRPTSGSRFSPRVDDRLPGSASNTVTPARANPSSAWADRWQPRCSWHVAQDQDRNDEPVDRRPLRPGRRPPWLGRTARAAR